MKRGQRKRKSPTTPPGDREGANRPFDASGATVNRRAKPPAASLPEPARPSWSAMAKSSAAVRSAPRNQTPAPATRLKAVDKKNDKPTADAALPESLPQIGLTDEQLEAIWKTFKRTRDENLRNILIEHHMPLVRMIAERLLQTLPKSIELDDLSSAGTFGLMDAINGFDLARGIKFKTYCTTRIRGSILDELRSQDWVPRLVRLKAHKLERAMRQLEGDLGRSPNQAELAEALGLTLDALQAHEAEANAKTIFSLSEKWDDADDDKEMEKVEVLADKKCPDPMEIIQQRDALETITRNLTKKERLIIIMYYYEGLTMREIGEIMELTESRVCQIHSNVMARLKAQLDRVTLQTV
jgi:RNA polymerase sigma factor FliA